MRVSVIDSGAGFEPPAATRDPSLPGGLGLVLVEQLSDAWGGIRTEAKTCVWSEIVL